nr:subtilisin-like protease SBT1.8 [Ipomoea trifida]
MASVFCFTSISVLLLLFHPAPTASATRKTYIVHMKHGDKPSSFETHRDWYSARLQSISGDSASLLYSYSTAYHGFAAALDAEEAAALRRDDGVVGVYEDTVYGLHTTRTPEFLGLDSGFGRWVDRNMQVLNRAAQDVIIGVLDTGVWPESKSFSDEGLPAVPARWRGRCESGPDFDPKVHCNKKLIGARFFSRGFKTATGMVWSGESESPRDNEGHGTHTASTAAGSHVTNASLFGYAAGVARGMAPHARVATYKVCWKSGCFGSDILAGIEQAIHDGVHVLSMSLGGGSVPYYRDTIAMGAFSAMERGIFVSCSAGNSGPIRSSVANVAPWIMTVGAGTIDRDFPAYATLGTGKRFTGVSLYSGKGLGKQPIGLVYNSGTDNSGNLCLRGSLDPKLVKGKVVLCDRGSNARVEKGLVVKEAGGVGMIIANTEASGEELVADSHTLPTVAVGMKTGDAIREYAKTAKNPTAVLSFGGTVVNVKPSPVIAAFSSRGPNTVTPQILKPDVIGPGVNILASWSMATGPTGLQEDTRRTPFNILSGTSMSCPHISGLAALLKAAHPKWSPSAIKSALMTTAYTLDSTNSTLRDAEGGLGSSPWAYGSGHVDPHKALNPGLVYDISTTQYITFLCSLDYDTEHIRAMVKRPNVTCDKKFRDPGQLNYPSFSVVFGGSRVVRYTRVLTNVGTAGTAYEVAVEVPPQVWATVKPTRLEFKNVGERLRYTVTFVARKGVKAKNAFGSISWNSGENRVKSPVAFSWTEVYGG